MKKVFLGLFLAGTMVSFTTVNTTATEEDFDSTCCTAIGGGRSFTRCVQGNNRSAACGWAQLWLDISFIGDPQTQESQMLSVPEDYGTTSAGELIFSDFIN